MTTGGPEAGGYGFGGPEAGPAACLAAFRAALDGTQSHGGRAQTLCFALPHDLPARPANAIPVFGWGFSNVPDEVWDNKPQNNWRVPLQRAGRAICFSTSAATALRSAMGEAFPIAVIPPPVPEPPPRPTASGTLKLALTKGAVLDTATWPDTLGPEPAFFSEEDDLADASAATPSEEVLFDPEAQTEFAWRKTARYRLGVTRLHATEWYRDAVRDLLPESAARAASRVARLSLTAARAAYSRLRPQQHSHPLALEEPAPSAASGNHPPQWQPQWQDAPVSLDLSGTLFAAVHGVWDRSWSDAISAFVWSCRNRDDATLVIRSHGIDPNTRGHLASFLRRLGPFRCRIVLFEGSLSSDDEAAWMHATHFYVCASHAEGTPLPIMRFMAHGTPVLSPVHSALADLLDEECAIVTASTPAHDYWPHDRREKLRTTSQRLDWESLCAGYNSACAAAANPALHARMAKVAASRIRDVAGPDAIRQKLDAFMNGQPA